MTDTLPPFAGILWTGSHLLDLRDPEAALIEPADIARGLARLFRFNGHTSRPWSVLSHSILCEELAARAGATAAERLAVLIHDAPEYLLGDMATPIKVLMPEYRKIEARLAAAVGIRFGMIRFLPGIDAHRAALRHVAAADAEALEIERAIFLPADLHGPCTFERPARKPDAQAVTLVARLSQMGERQSVETFLGLILTLTAQAEADLEAARTARAAEVLQ